MDNSGTIHNEYLEKDLIFSHPIQEVIFEDQTPFQDVKFYKSKYFGKCLIMDGHMQSAEVDEHIYHESLVHPVLLSHPNPKTVFLGGGGEGATLREILKHDFVKEVVMVDIDEKVVHLSRTHLKEWCLGSYEDPRVKVIFGDAEKYLRDHPRIFDVIIMDICDPIEEGPGWRLYTQDFYLHLRDHCMDDQSVLCTQSTAANITLVSECYSVINKTLRTVFSSVQPYFTDIPSFGCTWGFHIASKSPDQLVSLKTSEETVNELLKKRLGTEAVSALMHYDGISHCGMFNTPKYLRQACEKEDRVLSLDNPIYML